MRVDLEELLMKAGDLPKSDEVAMAIYMLTVVEGPKTGSLLAWTFLDHERKRVGMPENRAYFILEKWTNKGYWEYGTSVRGGWFTEKGLAWAREVRELSRSELSLAEQTLLQKGVAVPSVEIPYTPGGVIRPMGRELTDKFTFRVEMPFSKFFGLEENPQFFGSPVDINAWRDQFIRRETQPSGEPKWFPRLWLFDRVTFEPMGHIAVGFAGPAQGKTEVSPQANEVWAVASPSRADAHQYLKRWAPITAKDHAHWWATRSMKMKLVGADQVICCLYIVGDGEPTPIYNTSLKG
jgi:hypothetical protein